MKRTKIHQWKARFVKVDRNENPVRPIKHYICTVPGHNMINALHTAVDHMIDHIDPVEDSAFMRIVKLEIQTR
jgi:hypothetical protein